MVVVHNPHKKGMRASTDFIEGENSQSVQVVAMKLDTWESSELSNGECNKICYILLHQYTPGKNFSKTGSVTTIELLKITVSDGFPN